MSDNSNWLGFSLSPHMKMESPSSSDQHHQYLHEAPQTTTNSFFYGVSQNGAFLHSPLSFMPLKSDGSLCFIDALSSSHPPPQGMVSSESPKLEDFLGAHHYYQNAAAGKPCYPQPHHNHFFSGETHLAAGDQIGDLKNWVTCLDQNMNINNNNNNNVVDHHDDGGCGGAPAGGSGLQSLSLSMSPGSQSSCVTAPGATEYSASGGAAVETKKRAPGKAAQKKQPVHRKSIDTFGQRTSQYRGVTRHRWTGRYEAHLWDNSCKKEGQTRKGRQVYLGGYDMEDKAARAYDLAALKYWGPSTHINFPLENYQTELEGMKNMNRQEFVAHLRRKSSGFSRGASIYRGVTRHHQHGRWQARIGRVAGNKDLYLGTFSTQEEAAEAYDVAAIKFRGVNAVTNFDITRYDVERIMASNTLLSGELARRVKETDKQNNEIVSYQQLMHNNGEANVLSEANDGTTNGSDWKMCLYQSEQEQQTNPFVDDKSMSNGGGYRTSSFSMGLQGQGGAHFSDPSSLVTSLSSSREGSPDRNGAAMVFAKPPLASKYAIPTPASSWFPTAQLPIFAAWNDA